MFLERSSVAVAKGNIYAVTHIYMHVYVYVIKHMHTNIHTCLHICTFLFLVRDVQNM